MALNYDYVTPAALTGYVRAVPTPAQIQLERYLPTRQINDIEAIWNEVTRTNRAATYRAFDAETPIGQRDSFSQKRIQLPPLGQKTVVGEYERLQLERMRTGGNADQAIVDAIYDDAEINTRAVLWRMELARGDVLVDGKFTLTGENGLTIEADFGVPGSHIVAPSTLWTVYASATPLADLRAWVQLYIDDNGEAPGRMLMSSKRVTDLCLNAEVRALAATTFGTPSIVTPGQLQQVLSAQGLPPIETYDSQVDVAGVTTRIIPQDRVIFLPANPADLGYTAMGITAEALELTGGNNPQLVPAQAPGLVGVVMKDGDPVRTWTKVGAVGMPILTNPKLLLVADVA